MGIIPWPNDGWPPIVMAYKLLLWVMGILNNLFSIFQDQRETLDLTSFGDELALRTSWEPLVGGGTNFCTH